MLHLLYGSNDKERLNTKLSSRQSLPKNIQLPISNLQFSYFQNSVNK